VEVHQAHSTILPQDARTKGRLSARPQGLNLNLNKTLAKNFPQTLSKLSGKNLPGRLILRLPRPNEIPKPNVFFMSVQRRIYG
jgi:hypothetical protein